MTTPIRKSLNLKSKLNASIKDGVQAVKGNHKKHIDTDVRSSFSDSLDLDEAFRSAHGQEHRWDYLLGHKDTDKIFALEPHSATDGEMSVVIAKRATSRSHLSSHLKSGACISEWFWVASGKVDFTSMDKAELRLANNGIKFIGTKLLKKHLK